LRPECATVLLIFIVMELPQQPKMAEGLNAFKGQQVIIRLISSIKYIQFIENDFRLE